LLRCFASSVAGQPQFTKIFVSCYIFSGIIVKSLAGITNETLVER
jgi:hypothetical protein